MVLRSPCPSAPRTPVPFVVHVGVHIAELAPCSSRNIARGKAPPRCFYTWVLPNPCWGLPRGRSEAAGAQGGCVVPEEPLQTQAFCKPIASHHDPTSSPFFPALLADNATSVPDLKGALSGGCRCRGSPGPGAAPLLLLPYGIGAVWELGELALLSCHQGGPRVPPPSAHLYYPRALYRTRLLRLSFCAGKGGWDGALSRS